MATVFEARDELLGREVAIKVLHIPNLAGAAGQMFRQRFANEARAVSALAHPNIVQVFDMGFEDGVPFLVLERVAGPSLARWRGQERLASDDVQRVGMDVARALAVAHEAGVLHRDVKPENILRASDGSWKLADFGVARIPDSTMTLAGQFLGTSVYAAPESLVQGACSRASDIYSLGVTLYELLAGERPFGDQPLTALAKDVPPLARTDVDTELARLVSRMLARTAAERPTSVDIIQTLGRPAGGASVAVAMRRATAGQATVAARAAAAAPSAAVAATAAAPLTDASAVIEPIATAATVAAAPTISARRVSTAAVSPRNVRGRLIAAVAVIGILAIGALTISARTRPRPKTTAASAAAAVVPSPVADDAFAGVRGRIAAGDLTGARDELRQILASDPGNETAREWLERIESALDEQEEQR
jgi:eukaryotic-like serine/threonine-protein kinase